MAPRPLAALALVLVLAARADRDEDLDPAIPPPPAETARRAEAGDAAAQFELAEHRLVAEPDDPEPMLRWLRESAKRGYPLAQTSLGVLYLDGDGVPPDRVEAYARSALAADRGEPGAPEAEGPLGVELSDEELARAKELASRYATSPERP